MLLLLLWRAWFHRLIELNWFRWLLAQIGNASLKFERESDVPYRKGRPISCGCRVNGANRLDFHTSSLNCNDWQGASERKRKKKEKIEIESSCWWSTNPSSSLLLWYYDLSPLICEPPHTDTRCDKRKKKTEYILKGESSASLLTLDLLSSPLSVFIIFSSSTRLREK